MKPRTLNRRQGGVILLMVLALVAIGSMLTASFYALLHVGLADAYQRGRRQAAMNLADAGMEKAVAALRVDPRYAGEADTPLGEGIFSVTVTPEGRAGRWRLVSTGTHGTAANDFHASARVVADLQLDGQGRLLALFLREDGPCR